MPWLKHLPPVCWSTYGNLVLNDSCFVCLTQRETHFSLFLFHFCIYIYVYCCWFRCYGTGKRFFNRKETSCLTLHRSWEVSDTNSPANWMPTHKPTELSRIKLKTQQPVPMMSEHSAHLTWHCRLAFAPGSGDIHVCCCLFRCSGTGKRFSNRKETRCIPLLNAGFEAGDSQTPICIYLCLNIVWCDNNLFYIRLFITSQIVLLSVPSTHAFSFP